MRFVGQPVGLTRVTGDALGVTKRQCAVLLTSLCEGRLGPKDLRKSILRYLKKGGCGPWAYDPMDLD